MVVGTPVLKCTLSPHSFIMYPEITFQFNVVSLAFEVSDDAGIVVDAVARGLGRYVCEMPDDNSPMGYE